MEKLQFSPNPVKTESSLPAAKASSSSEESPLVRKKPKLVPSLPVLAALTILFGSSLLLCLDMYKVQAEPPEPELRFPNRNRKISGSVPIPIPIFLNH
ncbi:hypothetical protein CASFOL_018526 [Castilleja foliolosa]|uniref:Uncharacterized protein n=1 Tax=Castilleja foliolosa TaxID=1961234 RepID=A0ABD3D5U0_9LAMI